MEKKESSLYASKEHPNYQSTCSSSLGSSPRSNADTAQEVILNNEANNLSDRLVAYTDDEVIEGIVLKKSFLLNGNGEDEDEENEKLIQVQRKVGLEKSMVQRLIAMLALALLGLAGIFVLLRLSTLVVGPPSQPVGPYKLVEAQVCEKKSFYIVF